MPGCAVDEVRAVMNTNSTRLFTAPKPNWPTATPPAPPMAEVNGVDHGSSSQDGDGLLGGGSDADAGDVGGEPARSDGGGVFGDRGIDDGLHLERVGIGRRDERQGHVGAHRQRCVVAGGYDEGGVDLVSPGPGVGRRPGCRSSRPRCLRWFRDARRGHRPTVHRRGAPPPPG